MKWSGAVVVMEAQRFLWMARAMASAYGRAASGNPTRHHKPMDVMSMDSWQVEFVGVGRNKLSWTDTVTQYPTEPLIERLVKKRPKAVMSREVECCMDGSAKGTIYVGGFRPVGSFCIRPTPNSGEANG